MVRARAVGVVDGVGDSEAVDVNRSRGSDVDAAAVAAGAGIGLHVIVAKRDRAGPNEDTPAGPAAPPIGSIAVQGVVPEGDRSGRDKDGAAEARTRVGGPVGPVSEIRTLGFVILERVT